MDAKDYLFYGFGQIVYSLALSDGRVQREERRKLHDLIEKGLKDREIDYNNTEIIFELLDRENVFTSTETYNEGLKNMKLGGHKLTPQLKDSFVHILTDVATSYPPVTSEEQDVMTLFRTDLETIH